MCPRASGSPDRDPLISSITADGYTDAEGEYACSFWVPYPSGSRRLPSGQIVLAGTEDGDETFDSLYVYVQVDREHQHLQVPMGLEDQQLADGVLTVTLPDIYASADGTLSLSASQ